MSEKIIRRFTLPALMPVDMRMDIRGDDFTFFPFQPGKMIIISRITEGEIEPGHNED